MPIEFRCTRCSRLLRTPDDTVGKRAKCPDCGEVMTIPSPDSVPPPPPGPQPTSPGSPFGTPGATPVADDRNPYRSPVDFEQPAAPYGAPTGQFTPTRIDIGNVLSRTWAIFKERIGICMGAFFLAFIINLVVGQILGQGAGMLATMSNDQVVAVSLVVLANIAAQLFSLWISIGQALVFLRIARGQPVELGELFAGGPYLLPALGASILFGLAVLAGLILLIVPGIILALMFSQFFYLVIDRKAGVIESLELSKQITSGNKLTLFLLGLVVMGLGLLAMLPCLLGLIVYAPFVSLLWPVTYLSMTGQPTAEQRQVQYQPA